MIDMRDQFDDWLDTALAEYATVESPLGFEHRILAEARGRQRKAVWLWTPVLAAAAVAIVLAFVVALNRPLPNAPPALRARITVPAFERVTVQPAQPRQAPVPKPQLKIVGASVRGVPIVASPLTSQEKAMVQFSRNSRAKQWAGLFPDRAAVSVNADRSPEFQQLEIPLLVKEEAR